MHNHQIIFCLLCFSFFFSNNAYSECISGNCIDGQGTEKLKDTAQYSGMFKNGKWNGQGTLTLDEVKYSGVWENSTWPSVTTKVWPNGNKYTGDIKNLAMHGHGTMIYSNGDKYVGDWYHGKRFGNGTYTWVDGKKYVGAWINGKKHGKGTWFYKNGKREITNYNNGKKIKNTQTLSVSNGKKFSNSNIKSSSSSGACKAKVLGTGFSRANPIPNGSRGDWTIVCHSKDGNAWTSSLIDDRQDVAARRLQSNCSHNNSEYLYSLGGCNFGVPVWGQPSDISAVSFPKGMSQSDALKRRLAWLGCGDASGTGRNSANGVAKRICENKTGCECY